MKKILFTLAVLLSSFAAQAQEVPYQPLVVEGRTWVNNYEFHADEETLITFTYNYEFCGDSTVNEISYKKCFITVNDEVTASLVKNKYHNFEFAWDKTKPFALLREDGNKVLAIIDEKYSDKIIADVYPETGELILYDFDKIKEQVYDGTLKKTAVTIDKEQCNSYSDKSNNIVYVEGIGACDLGTLLFPTWECIPGTVYSNSYLSHVTNKEGQIVYTSRFSPFSGIDDVEVEKAKNDNQYYNIKGQVVDIKSVPAGIYIHNGKKVIVK